MWNYLFFLLHIGTKRDAELSGQEAYIRRMVRSSNIGFFPFKQTLGMSQRTKKKKAQELALQAANNSNDSGSSGGGDANMIETGLAVKRQTTVLENIKSAVENRGDMMLGVSRHRGRAWQLDQDPQRGTAQAER